MNAIKTVRTYFATRRELRKRERALATELAAYDTPSARLDLEAVLARNSSNEARELEAMLRLQALHGLVRHYR
ncbi:hypothetical protein KCV87_14350 [Actinosynnema pretiosum subsp. pretiosum]|uniref:Uncharacterized protein n=3 Tax=Actinosynnema TaxID=40566 RepID=C6WRB8_ACTMD|nr:MULTISPECIES: hypothetical protein [Actinosynnema]ACU35170.1 hypothetical protein Amir_1218 [Actinosynnema mirum DSM 43827]ATE52903.1 hypothetical protein CNX65_06085 [Actinosynnema pretiosum]AXX28550.1 hypothetical protein APASM_1185 [Actinosynnema pretiosum subsp. pretiosum]QUF07113.1 hypothetical protein KCV87_14350 [Actinosynnema pretiosum subsp. pretiosum]